MDETTGAEISSFKICILSPRSLILNGSLSKPNKLERPKVMQREQRIRKSINLFLRKYYLYLNFNSPQFLCPGHSLSRERLPGSLPM